MFQDKDLLNHIETSSSIKTQSAVIAEWNMNCLLYTSDAADE